MKYIVYLSFFLTVGLAQGQDKPAIESCSRMIQWCSDGRWIGPGCHLECVEYSWSCKDPAASLQTSVDNLHHWCVTQHDWQDLNFEGQERRQFETESQGGIHCDCDAGALDMTCDHCRIGLSEVIYLADDDGPSRVVYNCLAPVFGRWFRGLYCIMSEVPVSIVELPNKIPEVEHP